MKSADPEVIAKVSSSLDKTPIDTVAILDQVEVDNDRFIVSTILDSYISLSDNFKSTLVALERNELAMAENNRLMGELKHELQVYKVAHKQGEQSIRKLQSIENYRINQTTLAKFFLRHEDLVVDYCLGADNMVYYKGELLTAETNVLLYLSLDLEKFFGSRNISLSTLMNGLKRYLVAKEKHSNQHQEKLQDIVDDYFKKGKGRPKIRIPLKYLREACAEIPELTLPVIKALMYDMGYPTQADKNGIVYFYKVD